MRRAFLFLFPLLLIFLYSCGKQEKETPEISQNDTVQVQNADTVQLSENQEEMPNLGVEDIEIEIRDSIGNIDYLRTIAKQNRFAHSLIERMYKKLSEKKIKKSEILELLKMRDSLVNSPLAFVFDSLLMERDSTFTLDTVKLNNQLEYLGLSFVPYFYSVYEMPVLKYEKFLPKTLEQFPEAQELVDFRINVFMIPEIPHYTFGDMDYLFAAIDNGLNTYKLGENTLLYDYLKEDFLSWFRAIVDIHRTGGICVSGDCSTDAHMQIDCEIYKMFIEKHPGSPISKAMQKIIQDNNMSYVIAREADCSGFGNYDCYAVVVDTAHSLLNAMDKIFHYFLEGKDIPHLFYSDTTKISYVIYRFYSTEEGADSALHKINTQFPSAEIKHFLHKGYKLYEAEMFNLK